MVNLIAPSGGPAAPEQPNPWLAALGGMPGVAGYGQPAPDNGGVMARMGEILQRLNAGDWAAMPDGLALQRELQRNATQPVPQEERDKAPWQRGAPRLVGNLLGQVGETFEKGAGQTGAAVAEGSQFLRNALGAPYRDVREPGQGMSEEDFARARAAHVASRTAFMVDQLGMDPQAAADAAERDAQSQFDERRAALAGPQNLGISTQAPRWSETVLGGGSPQQALEAARRYAEANPTGAAISDVAQPLNWPAEYVRPLVAGAKAVPVVGGLLRRVLAGEAPAARGALSLIAPETATEAAAIGKASEPWYYSQLQRAAERLPEEITPTAGQTLPSQVAKPAKPYKGEPPQAMIEKGLVEPALGGGYQWPAQVRPEQVIPGKTVHDQVMSVLRSVPGVREDEVKWTGLEDWLKQQRQPTTRGEVLDYLKGNEVQVQEVVKGQAPTIRWGQEPNGRLSSGSFGYAIDPLPDGGAALRYQDGAWDTFGSMEAAKQGAQEDANKAGWVDQAKWARPDLLEAGPRTNDRELLLTLASGRPAPITELPPDWKVVRQGRTTWGVRDGNGYPIVDYTASEDAAVQAALKQLNSDAQYMDKYRPPSGNFISHAYDEPNILAWVRFNDRVDADGKRTLFIDELQSDWGQVGAKKGFETAETKTERERLFGEKDQLLARMDELLANAADHRARVELRSSPEFSDLRTRLDSIDSQLEKSQTTVPDAPLVRKWVELATRRMVRWGAENGYDRVAWTTGSQQARRYQGLIQNVRSLRYEPNSQSLRFTTADGLEHEAEGLIPREKLPEYVGGQTAKELLSDDNYFRRPAGIPSFHSLDAPPEGFTIRTSMTGKDDVYDVRAVHEANRIGKEFGAKVGETRIETGRTPPNVGLRMSPNSLNDMQIYDKDTGATLAEHHIWANGPDLNQVLEKYKAAHATAKAEPVHSIDISPEMRKSVVEQGMQLFPIISTGARPARPRGLLGSALRGAIAGSYGANQNEGATPQDVALGAGLGALGGIGFRAGRGALRRTLAGEPSAGALALMGRNVSRTAQRAAGQMDLPMEAAPAAEATQGGLRAVLAGQTPQAAAEAQMQGAFGRAIGRDVAQGNIAAEALRPEQRAAMEAAGGGKPPVVNLPRVYDPRGGFEQKPAVFIRFGRPPEGGLSERGGVPGQPPKYEAGTSVYKAWYDDKTGKYVIETPNADLTSTQQSLIEAAATGKKTIYQVSGSEMSASGGDLESLLDPSSVKITRTVHPDEIVTVDDPMLTLTGKELAPNQVPQWEGAQGASQKQAGTLQKALAGMPEGQTPRPPIQALEVPDDATIQRAFDDARRRAEALHAQDEAYPSAAYDPTVQALYALGDSAKLLRTEAGQAVSTSLRNGQRAVLAIPEVKAALAHASIERPYGTFLQDVSAVENNPRSWVERVPAGTDTGTLERLLTPTARNAIMERAIRAFDEGAISQKELAGLIEEYNLKSAAPFDAWNEQEIVDYFRGKGTLTGNRRVVPEPALTPEEFNALQSPLTRTLAGGPTAPREPWQMTRVEAWTAEPRIATGRHGVDRPGPQWQQWHESQVKQAISQGKPVPPEVLREYPDLAPKENPAGNPFTAALAGETPGSREPWQMTRAEFEADRQARRSAAIEAWNAAGAKGFPPTEGQHGISEIIPLAEKAGYVLPRDAEIVLRKPYHRLQVEAALSEGRPVPQEVLNDYPDLAKQQPRGTLREALAGERLPEGAGVPQNKAMKEPWQMTRAELEKFSPPSELSDRSRDVGAVAELRTEMGTLLDYAGDNYSLLDWLGHGYNKATDMSHLAGRVKANQPIKVYRATDAEDAIFPGAYVTPSRRYAEDHAYSNISGGHLAQPAAAKVLEIQARPDELVPMNPNEFFYAPKDIGVWHKAVVEDALRKGEPVPQEVLAEYPDLQAKYGHQEAR